MGKKKQRYTSFHLHLSNQLKHLPRKLAHLRSEPPAAMFDSFRSLGLSDCNLNNNQMLEAPAQYNNTAVVVPPSDRFFVSPSTSGLITLDQRVKSSQVVVPSPFTSSSNSTSSDHESVINYIPGDGIAVSTDSDDPYGDFKQSMQEMLHHYAKAHHRVDALDWDLLEELLFCYLELNQQSMHCYIIKAFADVVVAALRPPCSQLDRSIDGDGDGEGRRSSPLIH